MGHGFGPGRCLVLWYSKLQEIAMLSVYNRKIVATPMAAISSNIISILLLLTAIAGYTVADDSVLVSLESKKKNRDGATSQRRCIMAP